MSLGMECNKDYPITPDEVQTMMQKYQIPNSKNAKCLMACVYRKVNWLDSKGTFDVDSANSMMEKEHADDPAKMEKAKKLFEICKKVNDEPVTDGNEGCDRSAHMFQCLVENALKMGFKIQ
uniref:Odorant binding protein n=1 Tax=Eogystia hippophaecolus TaxID=1206364 RepID=A0A1B3P5J7_EOGHI|nr:odorant binding protein [Eogystia hippophaecolus]